LRYYKQAIIQEEFMNKLITLIVFAFSLIPLLSGAEEPIKVDGPIKTGDVLTLNRCIDIALQQQPSLVASQYNIQAGESRVGEAQSAYFPQLSVSGGYSRVKPLSGGTTSSSSLNEIGSSGRNSSFDQYTGSATVSQTIFDFGKTPTQVKIQKLNLDASHSDFDATRAQTIFSVKQAYYGVLQTQRNLDVAKETVTQFSQHLDQAKGFYEVGVKPKFDVTKAEVDLSNAKLNQITADNALRIARVTLNNAIGLPDAPEYSVEDSLAYVKRDFTISQEIETAFKNRPELQANELRVKSAEASVTLAKTGFFPVVTGNAAYNRASTTDASFREEGWNAGVTVTFPIFSGFLTRHQVAESTALYNAAKANNDLLRQNVILEVQQAALNVRAASDRIPTAELATQQATENLEIASGRYAAGVGNPIEVTDAQVLYSNAKTAYTQALYDYNVAIANLDKAIGVK
jgi:outer membrane protein TolC